MHACLSELRAIRHAADPEDAHALTTGENSLTSAYTEHVTARATPPNKREQDDTIRFELQTSIAPLSLHAGKPSPTPQIL